MLTDAGDLARCQITLRINLNAGWLHDRVLKENFFTYGAGYRLASARSVDRYRRSVRTDRPLR